jgi:uncharacterized phosphosugar-binding protein
MSAVSDYLTQIGKLVTKISDTQTENIQSAAEVFAESIANKRAVYIFGSGHSVLPVMDIFPRYGSYVGFHPIYDPRLMWTNITGPGGARELLWLEREPGYIKNVLLSYHLDPKDSMLVFSHGGMNAAGIEIALEAKSKGLKVVAVTSVANRKVNTPKHSSGKSLHDIANIVIDNCSPFEDSLVKIKGISGNVAASSTVTSVIIAQSLVAETANKLAAMGKTPKRIFVSPNVTSVPKNNNEQVFFDYMEFDKNL